MHENNNTSYLTHIKKLKIYLFEFLIKNNTLPKNLYNMSKITLSSAVIYMFSEYGSLSKPQAGVS